MERGGEDGGREISELTEYCREGWGERNFLMMEGHRIWAERGEHGGARGGVGLTLFCRFFVSPKFYLQGDFFRIEKIMFLSKDMIREFSDFSSVF